MKQPHTEGGIKHTDNQQNTGNHKQASAPSTEKTSGTRAGAEHVEPAKKAEKKPAH